MPIKKSRKACWIILAVILLGVFVENGCLQASLASLRVRRGMTVSQALQVAGDWTWGFAYCERPLPRTPFTFLLVTSAHSSEATIANLSPLWTK